MTVEHMTFVAVRTELEKCFQVQHAATDAWHSSEPEAIAHQTDSSCLEVLEPLILAQHLMNFRLWHVEDIARRKDVGPEVIADCKYRIDGLNQRRNDLMEKIDMALFRLLVPMLPEERETARMNSESLGMAVDRLSILSLKIFHMREQTERDDVDSAHVASCEEKLCVLNEQRADLVVAIFELLDDYASGAKRPKIYYQCKMYNDPALNPELYSAECTELV